MMFLALKGIGRYTAGAILSISRGQKLPILEGNTVRVFSRWIAMQQTPTDTPANKLLWQVAEKMLPRTDAGIFNQAAMELGALVCTPRKPKCGECPVASSCRARALGLQAEIPGKVTKTKYEDRSEYALIIADPKDDQRQRYLMRPLPDGARWAGLWDFPRPTADLLESPESVGDWLASELGIGVKAGLHLKTIKHAVTKYRISLHVHAASLSRSRKKLPHPWRFVTIQEMAELPMSVTGRKITKFLAAAST